ncbi:MAG: hypothetical protein ABJE95_09630 [Byssovorax sp.]
MLSRVLDPHGLLTKTLRRAHGGEALDRRCRLLAGGVASDVELGSAGSSERRRRIANGSAITLMGFQATSCSGEQDDAKDRATIARLEAASIFTCRR